MKSRIISKILILTFVLSLVMSINIAQTHAIASEEYIGEIHLMSFNYAPRNWMLCRGQVLNISQNRALFELIGNKFGGDGTTTFALPNLEAAEPQAGQPGYGMHYCIAVSGIYPQRQ